MKSQPADDSSSHLSGEQHNDNKKTWFIADLHLDVSRPHLFEILHLFLDEIQGQAEALYILGDLFEFWIGDDLINDALGAPYLPVIEHLKELSGSGTRIYFTQGNRDFLLRKAFMDYIGGVLLPDTLLIDLYGTPTIILHGDTLCTDDKSYQRMRSLFRQRWLQKLYLSLSLERRAKQANYVRGATRQQLQEKQMHILDVNQHAVEALMRSYNVTQMIHGHTHRPAHHSFKLDGKQASRYVLGDWHDKASFLEASKEGLRLAY